MWPWMEELDACERSLRVCLLAQERQVVEVLVVPEPGECLRCTIGFGVDRTDLGADRRPASLGLHGAKARLGPRHVGPEAGAVRDLEEAVAEDERADCDRLEEDVVPRVARHYCTLFVTSPRSPPRCTCRPLHPGSTGRRRGESVTGLDAGIGGTTGRARNGCEETGCGTHRISATCEADGGGLAGNLDVSCRRASPDPGSDSGNLRRCALHRGCATLRRRGLPHHSALLHLLWWGRRQREDGQRQELGSHLVGIVHLADRGDRSQGATFTYCRGDSRLDLPGQVGWPRLFGQDRRRHHQARCPDEPLCHGERHVQGQDSQSCGGRVHFRERDRVHGHADRISETGHAPHRRRHRQRHVLHRQGIRTNGHDLQRLCRAERLRALEHDLRPRPEPARQPESACRRDNRGLLQEKPSIR